MKLRPEPGIRRQACLVGQPGSGKTTFLRSFARLYADRLVALPAAGTGNTAPKTGDGHSAQAAASVLEFHVAHRRGVIRLVDTRGLYDELPPHNYERELLLATFKTVYQSDVIFHVMDAAQAGRDLDTAVSELDRVLAAYGQGRPGYALLANKIDLPAAQWGLWRLREQFPHNFIIPISALYGTGFRLVESFLSRQL